MTTVTLKSTHAPPPPTLRLDPQSGDSELDNRRFREAVETYSREMTLYVDRYVRQQSQDMNTISGTELDADATEAAETAQAQADANLLTLQNIASDSKITPVEKLLAKQYWDAIVAEGNTGTGTLTALATTFSVDDSDFDTDYAALNTYLNTTLNVFSDMTSTTTVVRADWDTAWKNYYDERTKLMSAIDTASKTLADNAQSAADAAQADADTAQAAADAAQGTADANLATLNEIAADTKVTPVEKLIAKQMWNVIVAEGTDGTGTLPVQAAAFSVDDSAFDTAYAALDLYLNTTLNVFGSMSSTTTVVRATWDSTWEAYYSAKLNLLNDISDKAKSLADAAQSDADTAQAAADAAQGDATTALNTLSDIASDSKITPVEKYTIKPIWDSVVAEATLTTGTLVVQAAQFSVDDSDFDTAYSNLYGYLITTLDVFGTMTATTTINRSTWDTYWEAYYDERTNLLNDIADAAKTLADNAQSAADAAQGDATTALNTLSDIASDSKITPVEKYTIKPIWDNVVAEATLTTGTLVVQAAAFSVDDSDFDSAYAALYGYIITTLDVFGTMSATTTINRTTWDGHWELYYAERTNLLNDISLAAKTLADDAQTDADAAQTDATQALSELDDIAADNKVTPVEKLEAYQRWLTIVEEGTATTGIIPVQATAFSVDDSDFDTAYAALDLYLNTTLNVFGNMTTTTTVTRATWNSTWKAYYDERTNVLNDIAAAAKTLADNAQSAADAAQGDATTALNTLADIAADNKITPVEKYTIKPIWDSVVAEATLVTGTLVVQAASFSVDDSDFDTAYSDLYGYLITTLDVFGTMTATTTITRATWDGYWEAYYDERTNLLNDIALAAKTLADNAQTAADAAQGDATTALNSLADIADDEKVTPVEKLEAYQRWLTIVEEGTATTGLLPVQATAFSVDDSDFDTAYAALDLYLNTTLAVFSNMSATTTVTRATWNSTWKDYYDERTNLLNDIATAAKNLADAAQADADTAQAAADAAQGTADTNTATLADIADDGEITPVEKLIAKQLWDNIVTEGTATTGTIPVQATAFSVDDSSFDSAFAALDTYLNTTLTVFSNMSTSTSVTRATWDATWSAYYDAKVDLLMDIAAAAKSLSDQANRTLNNVTITAPIIRTATSGRRIQMDVDGIKFYTAQTAVGVYGTTANGGSNILYGTTANGGDNFQYGTGMLARFYNMTNGIPFDVQLEQTVADMHLYNRSSTPSGAATIGDVCVVSGVFYICTSGGTPGTWTKVGTQT